MLDSMGAHLDVNAEGMRAIQHIGYGEAKQRCKLWRNPGWAFLGHIQRIVVEVSIAVQHFLLSIHVCKRLRCSGE
jgi:hypothetical protein